MPDHHVGAGEVDESEEVLDAQLSSGDETIGSCASRQRALRPSSVCGYGRSLRPSCVLVCDDFDIPDCDGASSQC
jgi:hypothetical protein